MLLSSSNVYTLDGSWVATGVGSVAGTESWHWADFGTYIVLANGAHIYERHYSTGLFSEPSTSEFPTCKTICAFRGQLIGGNVQSSWYDCDQRYAVWSAIGEDTFVPDWKNEAGYRDMEIGTIHKVLPLGDEAVIFYGAEGIAMLYPAKQTFWHKKLSSVGAAGRDAAGGYKQHVFVSTDSRLYTISSEGEQRIGYKEWLSGLVGADIVISYDQDLNDFYISDDDSCFVLSQAGLTESSSIPTWLNRIDGSLVGCYAASSESGILLELEYQDLGLVAMKSMEFIEPSLVSDGTIYAKVDGYYSKGQTEREGSWIRLDVNNFMYSGLTANMHKIAIKSADATSFNLDQLTYSVKLSDNRIQNQLQTLSMRT